MNNRLMIFMGGFLVAILVAAGVVAVLKIDLAPKDEKPGKRPARTQNLGEGIKVSQHGFYGVDLVSIGKAHMRKLRKGPFTIGAINELVLEDVALALPEDVWKGKDEVEKIGGGGQGTDNSSVQPSTANLQPGSGPRAMLSKLGINAGNLKMGGSMPRFSALAIRGLKVSRIEGTNAVPWFAAKRAEARRAGLHLENGYLFENGQPLGWNEAMLVFEPKLALFPMR